MNGKTIKTQSSITVCMLLYHVIHTCIYIFFDFRVFLVQCMCHAMIKTLFSQWFHIIFELYNIYLILSKSNIIQFNSEFHLLTSIYDLPFYVFRHIILVSYICEKVIDNHLFSIFIPLWGHETLIDHITPLPTS